MSKRAIVCVMFISFLALSIPQSSSGHCPLGQFTANLKSCIADCWNQYPRRWRDFIWRGLCIIECEAHYAGHIGGELAPFLSIEEPPVLCHEATGTGAISLAGSTMIVVTCVDPEYSITSLHLEHTTDGTAYTDIGTDSDPSDGWSVLWDVTGLPQDAGALIISMTTLPGQTPGDEPLRRVVSTVINYPEFDPCTTSQTCTTPIVKLDPGTAVHLTVNTQGANGTIRDVVLTGNPPGCAPPDSIKVLGGNRIHFCWPTACVNQGDVVAYEFTVSYPCDQVVVTDIWWIYARPTLSEWVLIILALSVAGLFVWQLMRRRKAAASV